MGFLFLEFAIVLHELGFVQVITSHKMALWRVYAVS